MNAIETTQLTKRFGRITAVHNLNLVVKEGDIFGFLGLVGGVISSLFKKWNLLS